MQRIPLHHIFIAAIVLLLSWAPFALASAQAPSQTPEELIESTASRVMQAIEANRGRLQTDPSFLFGLVEETILPHIDFDGMSKLILGKYWRTATPAQRDGFVTALRNNLVRTYTLQLADHADKRLVVLPGRRPATDTNATVNSEIVLGSGQPNLPVAYSLRLVGGKWKVYDLRFEGLSLVANYRTNFATEIEQRGLDALIERLNNTRVTPPQSQQTSAGS